MIELANQRVQKSIGTPEDVYQLKHRLTEVKLRKASAADEKIAILTTAVADAKTEEEFDTKLYQAGVVDFLQTCNAKLYRLGLEERLLQAQGK